MEEGTDVSNPAGALETGIVGSVVLFAIDAQTPLRSPVVAWGEIVVVVVVVVGCGVESVAFDVVVGSR